jgi:hypothetical protein
VVLDKIFRPRTVAGIVVALVVAAGTAVAATSTGPRPTVQSDEVTTTTTEQATTTTTAEETTTTSTTAAPTTTTTAPDAGPNHDAHDNHGACVSAAAHDTPPGPGHGEAVSKVAKSDCGKSAKGGDDGTDEQEAPETDASHGHGHGHDGSDD